MPDNPADPNYKLYQRAITQGFGGLSKTEIKAVQNYLNVYYGSKLVVDGIAGPKTNAALSGAKSSAATPATAPSQPDTDIQEYLRKHFDYLSAFYNHPELGPLLRRAASEGWDQARLTGEVFNTSWWKTTATRARSWEALTITDPAEANRQRQSIQLEIANMANQLGLSLDQGKVNSIAEDSLRFGWSTAELTRALATQLTFDSALKGDIGQTFTNVKKAASDYLVPISNNVAFDYAKKVAMGEWDNDNVVAEMRNQAISRYGWLKPQLESGQTLAQLFDPIKSDIANLTETAPETIDLLNDPSYSKIVDFIDSSGNRRSMTRSEVATYVRGLDQWKSTRQSQAQVADVVNTVARLFGQVA
jgi:peptidoglycan hydrolase-like protein with peptidoglycan-binding domain